MKEKFFVFCVIAIIIASFVTLYKFCKDSGASKADPSADLSTEEIANTEENGSSVEETPNTEENGSSGGKPTSYRLTLSAEPLAAGSVSGEGDYEKGADVTLTATTENGYEFLGWYDGENVIGTTLTHRILMPSEDTSYVARWRACTYSVSAIAEPAKGGSVSGGGSYELGAEVTLVATPVSGYSFIGWYEGENKIEGATDLSYSFVLSTHGRSVTAKYEHVFTRLDDHYLLFGTYPQSAVSESSVVSALNAQTGGLPTESDSGSWTSYDYYMDGSNATDFMWYKDISYGGEKYRGVYFTSYRKRNIPKSGVGYAQDENGYVLSTVYWFKYEPIKWKILSEEGGETFIFCDMIIDSQEFNTTGGNSSFEHNGGVGYANNYALSSVRKWLNQTFYQTAFSNLQKQLIVLATVDNSARSANPNNNQFGFFSGVNTYAGGQVEDRVFLLSVQEATNSDYGFSSSWSITDPARHKTCTDYSKSQGLDVGLMSWWLRSPFSKQPEDAFCQHYNYVADRDYVFLTYYGISPALKIRI